MRGLVLLAFIPALCISASLQRCLDSFDSAWCGLTTFLANSKHPRSQIDTYFVLHSLYSNDEESTSTQCWWKLKPKQSQSTHEDPYIVKWNLKHKYPLLLTIRLIGVCIKLIVIYSYTVKWQGTCCCCTRKPSFSPDSRAISCGRHCIIGPCLWSISLRWICVAHHG